MVVMTMPKMTMAKMTMAMPVMAVASTVPTVTSSESLTGYGQSGQCQSSDCGGNDRLGLRHGRLLLGWAEPGSLCNGPPLEARAAMRCDGDHPAGGIIQLV